MKRFLIVSFISVVTLAGVFLLQSNARAEEDPLMTEQHIARIRSNCVEAQSSLNQLHTTDALLRVNRGPLYELISTKLIAPFNSRVALNKMDGTNLTVIAADYERELAAFRTNYKTYEEAMSKALKINCVNQPVAFYDSVVDARAKRKVVHENTINLKDIIQKYKDEFEVIAKTLPKGTIK
jgi:hypothetical protein